VLIYLVTFEGGGISNITWWKIEQYRILNKMYHFKGIFWNQW